MSNPEIIPADKAYRTKMFIIFAVLMLAVLALAQWGMPQIMSRIESALDSGDDILFMRYIRGIEAGLALLFLGFIPFCIYNVRMGLSVRKEQRFPSSLMRVLRDTTVITGDAAERRGRFLVGMGIVLMVVSLGSAAFAVISIETVLTGG
ncbi:MAG: hypothetical protein K8R90_10080 [Candidatus Cloacimonetes bacterium]|nr:hypothetical protein [Candidatus Cloacimonadota bacterium]